MQISRRGRKEVMEKTGDPRYQPPYPQGFYPFWPGHAIKGGVVVLLTIGLIVLLAYLFRVPTDFNTVLPDDGMYIPGPEWYFLFFLQPFWYLVGGLASWRFIGTLIIPILIITLFLLVPFLFKGNVMVRLEGGLPPSETTPQKAWLGRVKDNLLPRLYLAMPAIVIFILVGLGVYFSGYPAKSYGCIACHNPNAGVRHALPPMDVADYYKGARQMQIEVGRYRASKVEAGGGRATGEVETYKDANWQLRHIYEPTFTW